MDEAQLTRRLEKLSRDNRWLKGVVIVALLLPAAMILLAAAPASHTVTANKFVLVDALGRTRAVLQVGPASNGDANLVLLDAEGNKRVVLAGGTGPVGNAYASLKLGENATTQEFTITSPSGRGGVTLSDGGLVMGAYPQNREYGSVFLQGPGGSGPALEITDSQGYKAQLGVTNTLTRVTGEKHTTSAASLVLSSKDGKVIWQAP